MSVFVQTQGIETVHAREGVKMPKFCPRSCWMYYKKSGETYFTLDAEIGTCTRPDMYTNTYNLLRKNLGNVYEILT